MSIKILPHQIEKFKYLVKNANPEEIMNFLDTDKSSKVNLNTFFFPTVNVYEILNFLNTKKNSGGLYVSRDSVALTLFNDYILFPKDTPYILNEHVKYVITNSCDEYVQLEEIPFDTIAYQGAYGSTLYELVLEEKIDFDIHKFAHLEIDDENEKTITVSRFMNPEQNLIQPLDGYYKENYSVLDTNKEIESADIALRESLVNFKEIIQGKSIKELERMMSEDSPLEICNSTNTFTLDLKVKLNKD